MGARSSRGRYSRTLASSSPYNAATGSGDGGATDGLGGSDRLADSEGTALIVKHFSPYAQLPGGSEHKGSMNAAYFSVVIPPPAGFLSALAFLAANALWIQ